MRLTHKLTLGFLGVSLVAVGLAAVFVWFTTSIEFGQYVTDQRETQFVTVATDYYRTHGSWIGVDTALRQQGLLPPATNPGGARPDPQPIVLADADGMVVVAGGQYETGQKVAPSVLSKGTPIDGGGRTVGTVFSTGQQSEPSPLENRYLSRVIQSLLVAALGGAVIALLLGLLIARNLTRPLRRLTEATQSMAAGNMEERVVEGSRDELGELARAFNQMSADLARANQSRRQMTADIAHDLRNPLTVIGGYLESLQDGKLDPTPERFATMRAEVDHLQRLVDDLRTLSLADAGELSLRREPVEPAVLLGRVAAAFGHAAGEEGIRLVVSVQAGARPAALDPERIEQVLRNLVDNALRHTPSGGRVGLSAEWASEVLRIGVTDTGVGISPEDLPHVFERSYRADSSRSGSESGLGLAIARSIVELHGGSIRAESTPGQGSRFILEIPG